MAAEVKRLETWLPGKGAKLDWEGLNAAFSWVRDLKDVPQSPVYHAEGDVWIHTRMVMEELLQLKEYGELGTDAQRILFFATLMHDIAKPICTIQESDGNIASPRHAARGRNLGRYFLYSGDPGPVAFREREQIVNLIRYHGLPLWFLEKEDSRAAVLKAAELVDMRSLALLAEADVRGRICADQDDLLERVELFREYCKEQGVWDGPFGFENGHARWAYFENPHNGPLYVPYDDFRCEVVLMSGLPGAGKDHWVNTNASDWPVITLDDIRKELGITPRDKQGLVINTARERARQFLRKGQPFVWNATNLVPDIRKQLIGLFSDYKARVRVVYLEVPRGRLLHQNSDREDVVPPSVMERMMRKWEVPEVWEAPSVQYCVSEE